MTLALTQDRLGTDLGAVDEESAPPVLMTPPWGIVALPPLFLRLLAVVGLGMVVTGAVVAHRRRLVTWGSVLLGTAWLGWAIMRRWLSSPATGLGWSVCAAVLS